MTPPPGRATGNRLLRRVLPENPMSHCLARCSSVGRPGRVRWRGLATPVRLRPSSASQSPVFRSLRATRRSVTTPAPPGKSAFGTLASPRRWPVCGVVLKPPEVLHRGERGQEWLRPAVGAAVPVRHQPEKANSDVHRHLPPHPASGLAYRGWHQVPLRPIQFDPAPKTGSHRRSTLAAHTLTEPSWLTNPYIGGKPHRPSFSRLSLMGRSPNKRAEILLRPGPDPWPTKSEILKGATAFCTNEIR